MNKRQKRGFLATAGALITAAAMALGGSAAANAATVEQMPETSGVIITKFEQPEEVGTPANGLPGATGNPIAYVTFEAYSVDLGVTPGSNEWQVEAATATVANVAGKYDSNNAVRTGTTDADGEIRWQNSDASAEDAKLPRGLYLIREVSSPANVVPAGDFLLTVPLTDPEKTDRWLEDIYVYPKNRIVGGKKTVENAEQYVVGDTVTWTIDLDNPSSVNHITGDYDAATQFEIVDTIEDEYLSTTAEGVNVIAPLGLVKDTDYTVALTTDAQAGTTEIHIEFTTDGREALAAVMNGDSTNDRVEVTIDTVVKQVGVIKNSAQFISSDVQTKPQDVPGTEVRYGSIALAKSSTDDEADLAGAEFRVYLTDEAARAANPDNNWGGEYSDENLTGYLVPQDGSGNGIFVTDEAGKATIGGLRHSDYANGRDLLEDDQLWQGYYLVETKALAGHQLLGEPVYFEILGDEDGVNVSPAIEITNAKDGGFLLPLTGGTGTLIFTVLGVGILAAVLIVARRRGSAAYAE